LTKHKPLLTAEKGPHILYTYTQTTCALRAQGKLC
jgi:hypothetical protein